MNNAGYTLCTCAKYGHIDPSEIKILLAHMQAAGQHVEVTTDFCQQACDMHINNSCQDPHTKGIIACHTRAQQALCQYARLHSDAHYDLRSNKAKAIIEELQLTYDPNIDTSSVELPEYTAKHIAWYPTIDHDSCVKCGKCVDFCMFGVYEKDVNTKRIHVANPTNCKTNCPACARVCPHGAIIFPKHDYPPINGGDGESKDALNLEKALLDKNLYEKLAARRELARKIKLFNDPQ